MNKNLFPLLKTPCAFKSCNMIPAYRKKLILQMFQKLNTTIMNHIHDAEKVDVQLTKSLEETVVSH